MFNKNTECALRCLLFLAEQGIGVPILCRDIAHAVGVSEPCVANVLRVLAKRGVLESLKGKGGGFALRPEAASLSAYDILQAVSTAPEKQVHCILGQKECSDVHPCPLHGAWIELQERQNDLLKGFCLERLIPS
ncbi:Rrf2 family transcriptional regulator [Acidithiobacillus sp. IBUN Pt1247-S3]|uniref:RrF2 family transcriptional regulator n=1 Tax=Acidithiobacillus sp. IBUN Pt1247-S3 TaxID=3166642 RepID=UPI0034E475C0